jgi:hypothetical protein
VIYVIKYSGGFRYFNQLENMATLPQNAEQAAENLFLPFKSYLSFTRQNSGTQTQKDLLVYQKYTTVSMHQDKWGKEVPGRFDTALVKIVHMQTVCWCRTFVYSIDPFVQVTSPGCRVVQVRAVFSLPHAVLAHPSVLIPVSNIDNTMTSYCLRRLSGRPPDYT